MEWETLNIDLYNRITIKTTTSKDGQIVRQEVVISGKKAKKLKIK